MKTKTLLTVILSILLVSCAQASISTPTEKPTPTATITFTPIPSTPTFTPTPTPENLADTKDLQIWVEQYVNAYGGKVTLNGVDMDTIQLTDEIRKNVEPFTQVKRINEQTYQFIVVNNIPLAILNQEGKWEKATPKIGNLFGTKIGALLTGYWLLDPAYKGPKFMALLGDNFNGQATADLNWVNGLEHDLHPSLNQYDFAVPDSVVTYAGKKGLSVNFQSMFWGDPSFYPKWLERINDKEQFILATTDYVNTISKRYKGKVNSYVLINEFFGWIGYEGKQGNLLQQQLRKFGIAPVDFMVEMSAIIYKNDPTAHVSINDSGFEIPGTSTYYDNRSTLLLQLLSDLRAQDSKIDTVGLQMHLNAEDFIGANAENNYLNFVQRLQLIKELGYRIQITELDVRLNDLQKMSPEEKMQLQGEIYRNIISVAITNGVTDIDIWGIQDGDSFLEHANWLNNPQNSDPLLFDDQLRPKPAYYSVLQALYNRLK